MSEEVSIGVREEAFAYLSLGVGFLSSIDILNRLVMVCLMPMKTASSSEVGLSVRPFAVSGKIMSTVFPSQNSRRGRSPFCNPIAALNVQEELGRNKPASSSEDYSEEPTSGVTSIISCTKSKAISSSPD